MQRVLLLMMFICSFGASSSETVLEFYNPFGEQPLVIKGNVAGICAGQSKLIIREDAWRCMAEGKTFDPCFAKSVKNTREVFCPLSPWSRESIQIQVNEPLNNEHHVTLDMSRALPWGIELENGERCQAIDTTDLYDSMPVRYLCGNKNVLVGYLQRCKAPWSMLEKTSEGVITARVRVVKF